MDCPEEILIKIFEFVYYEPDNWVDQRSLAALARTCRRFQNPALDILWSNLSTLKPLFHCLPEGSWTITIGGEIQLTRHSWTPEDWKACLKYTPRIKRLGIVGGSEYWDLELPLYSNHREFSVLQSNQISLPNLQDLRWMLSGGHFGDIHSIGPLQALAVQCFDFEAVRDVAEPLCSQSPLLEKLFFRMPMKYLSPNPELSCLLQSMVCRHQCLRQLFCIETLLPQEVLRFLSASKIEVLSIRNTAEELLQNLPTTEQGFSSLRRLTVYASHLKYCSELLQRINTRSLQSFEVVHLHLPDSLSIKELFQTLERRCSHALFNSVHLHQPRHSEENYHAPEYGLALSNFRPLFAFKNLEVLEIELFCPFRLDTSDIKLMAPKWPCMRQFKLGYYYKGFGHPSKISVNCLLSFARHWPDLEELSISLGDLWKISHVQGRPGRGYSCPKVIDLALGDSRVDSQSCYRPLAEFLDDFFPSIDGVIKRREMGSLERHIGPWVYITDIMAELATEREEAELDSDSQP